MARFDISVCVPQQSFDMRGIRHCTDTRRKTGASSMWAYQFARMQQVAEARGWTKFVSMQNHYSLCYREEEREMNPYCIETGVGLIPWAPLYRGFLARPRSGAD